MFLSPRSESEELAVLTYSGEELPEICFLSDQCCLLKPEIIQWNDTFRDVFS